MNPRAQSVTMLVAENEVIGDEPINIGNNNESPGPSSEAIVGH